MILLEYLSGTVTTQAGGAGASPPTGTANPAVTTPAPGGLSDHQGYTFPTNVIPGLMGSLFFCFTVDRIPILLAEELFERERAQ